MCLIVAVVLCANHPIKSQVSPEFIRQRLHGKSTFAWWDVDAPQSEDVIKDLRSELAEVHGSAVAPNDLTSWLYGKRMNNLTFGFIAADKAPALMYKATKVQGVWEQVPVKLRGVFWMRGNGIGGELLVLHYGKWFEQEQVYLVPMAPFTWAWAGGIPADAPYFGWLYQDKVEFAGTIALTDDGMPAMTTSYVVSKCPKHRACPEGSVDGTYAKLQIHRKGDLREDSVNANHLVPALPSFFKYVTGKFELEEVIYSPQPGSLWKRPCWWGVGVCNFLEFGSYDLVKIIDEHGEPLEPGHSEFISYMKDIPLYVWSGFASGAGKPPLENATA